jgi:hypothetical protein
LNVREGDSAIHKWYCVLFQSEFFQPIIKTTICPISINQINNTLIIFIIFTIFIKHQTVIRVKKVKEEEPIARGGRSNGGEGEEIEEVVETVGGDD